MRTTAIIVLILISMLFAVDGWNTEEIDYSCQQVGAWWYGMGQNSLVLDSNRNPHIAYIKYSADPLEAQIWYCDAYGSFNKEYVGHVDLITSVWHAYVPDVALVLDSQNHPHIIVATFMNYANNKSVFHYYKQGSTWVSESIQDYPNGTESDPGDISVAAKIDTNDHLHVVYSMDGEFHGPYGPRVDYATNKTGAWVIINPYNNRDADTITGCDLALDENGVPNISFVEKLSSNNSKIWWFQYDPYIGHNQFWMSEVVDDLSTYGNPSPGGTSIKMTDDRTPEITYYKPKPSSDQNNSFKIAARDEHAQWHLSDIDSDNNSPIGYYNSLALRANDAPDVTYIQDSKLYFGMLDDLTGAWDLNCIDTVTGSGVYNHLVLDPVDDGWYITEVVNSSGWSHLFIKWWAPILRGQNNLVKAQKPVRFAINSIYPSPAKTLVNCRYSLSQASEINLALYDLSGRLVSSRNTVGNVGDNEFTYDVSSLAPGIYSLKAASSGLVSIKKLVVGR